MLPLASDAPLPLLTTLSPQGSLGAEEVGGHREKVWRGSESAERGRWGQKDSRLACGPPPWALRVADTKGGGSRGHPQHSRKHAALEPSPNHLYCNQQLVGKSPRVGSAAPQVPGSAQVTEQCRAGSGERAGRWPPPSRVTASPEGGRWLWECGGPWQAMGTDAAGRAACFLLTEAEAAEHPLSPQQWRGQRAGAASRGTGHLRFCAQRVPPATALSQPVFSRWVGVREGTGRRKGSGDSTPSRALSRAARVEGAAKGVRPDADRG